MIGCNFAVCRGPLSESRFTQQKAMPVVNGVLEDDDDLLPDAAVASESLADFPLPIGAVPMESLIPDETVTEFCPSLS
jgi:hypothetical protein